MNRLIQIVALMLLMSNFTFAQNNTGEIYGRVTDEKNQPLDFATVTALQGDIVKGGKKTDLQGNYVIKPLAPGKYTIKVSFVGYPSQQIEGVQVGNDGRVKVNVQMEKGLVIGKGERCYRKSLQKPTY